jgi:hypothetical protein
MVNYKEGKIFKLISNQTNKIYIGSTIKTLNTKLKKYINSYGELLSVKQIEKIDHIMK